MFVDIYWRFALNRHTNIFCTCFLSTIFLFLRLLNEHLHVKKVIAMLLIASSHHFLLLCALIPFLFLSALVCGFYCRDYRHGLFAKNRNWLIFTAYVYSLNWNEWEWTRFECVLLRVVSMYFTRNGLNQCWIYRKYSRFQHVLSPNQ